MDVKLPDPVESIVVFRLGGLGDYVLSLPFWKELRARFPNAKITAILGPAGEELLQNQKSVDRIMVARGLSLPGSKIMDPLAMISDYFSIRKNLQPPYDLFVDLTSKYSSLGTLKPYLVHGLCRPKFSVGLDYLGRGRFLALPISEDRNAAEHMIQRYGRVLEALGGGKDLGLPEIQIPDACSEKARKYFSKFSADPKKPFWLGIHPGANRSDFKARAWSVERFADLIKKIHERTRSQIFITASGEETWLYERLLALTDLPLERIPETRSVLELCAYLGHLDGYISNDTGPMHCAVVQRVPTIGIFGKSDHATYGTYPEGLKLRSVLLSPEIRTETVDPRGLQKISVEAVWKEFLNLEVDMKTRKEKR